ncbi:hypothetical protein GCM10007890_01070 [Methylobacterium tardum]|uniref:Resolvase/invertase-type recombinase catalytic domain-containing protein n=1 Tax=Methylobacterium tardum TaxID=374432 RepID=A0AA37WPE2_9HYPH|nr:hypothetical protein GCM10007890_01070 [Methylobacterium tardum]
MLAILYARVSTAEQTIAHQRKQAEAVGFKIDQVVADEGVSGVLTVPSERLQGRRPFDMLRAGDVLVDPLGRPLGPQLRRRHRDRPRVHAPRCLHAHGDQQHDL